MKCPFKLSGALCQTTETPTAQQKRWFRTETCSESWTRSGYQHVLYEDWGHTGGRLTFRTCSRFSSWSRLLCCWAPSISWLTTAKVCLSCSCRNRVQILYLNIKYKILKTSVSLCCWGGGGGVDSLKRNSSAHFHWALMRQSCWLDVHQSEATSDAASCKPEPPHELTHEMSC